MASGGMRIGAGGLLVRGGRVLLAKRSAERGFYPGVWDVIGGHCESDEAPRDAFVREVREEIGVTPHVFEKIAVLEEPQPTEHGEGWYHIFLVTDWAGDPCLRGSEHSELCWLSLEGALALPLAHPGYAELLTAILRPRKERERGDRRVDGDSAKPSVVEPTGPPTGDVSMTRGPIQARIERCWREVAAIEEAFEHGEIDEAGWHRRMAELVVPAYLAGDNPRAQSGYSGGEVDWKLARSLVADAIHHAGTFLDVGCASGLLMESVYTWCRDRGLLVEPYGLDISPELAALARARLPHWAGRVFEGNAASWVPPFRFDLVRTGLEYVPRAKRPALITHLFTHVVSRGGRLLIGPYTEERDETRSEPSLEQSIRSWGFEIEGRIEREHARDDRVVRRLVYLHSSV